VSARQSRVSLERGQEGDQLLDFLFAEAVAVGIGHERHAVGRIHAPGTQVGTGLETGFAYIAFHVGSLTAVVGGTHQQLSPGGDAGRARPRALATGDGSAEHVFAQGPRIVIRTYRAYTDRGRAALHGSRSARATRTGHSGKAAGDQNRPRWPALVIHIGHPVEEPDQVGDFFLAQVLLRHQPAVALLVIERGRVTHVGLQVGFAAVLGDLGQV